MAFVRRDVWSFKNPWDPVIDWYGKAVAKLLTLPIEDPRSWKSLAAMHGINRARWETHRYLTPGQALPLLDSTLWNQCQHQSWYFLPWHRGYLACFEEILRATIVEMGGPETWALPYWNYNGKNPNAIRFPTAFSDRLRPDGQPNMLFVEARYGTDGEGNIDIDPIDIRLDGAMREGDFTDGNAGFGGPLTIFNHSAGGFGMLEGTPHGAVHVLVGGLRSDLSPPLLNVGLMRHPQTAALDPIFWLHHANIDRVWEVWEKRHPLNKNPSDPEWLNGPPISGRSFLLPDKAGVVRSQRVSDMDTIAKLGYEYDDVSDPLPRIPSEHSVRGTGSLLSNIFRTIMSGSSKTSSEFAANSGPIDLGGDADETRVQIDAASKPAGGGGLLSLGLGKASKPRVFLSLSGMKAERDVGVFRVYVAAPAIAGTPAGEERFVGTVSMFGASEASDPRGLHGGTGLDQTLDVTEVYQAMQATGELQNDEVTVRFRKAEPNVSLDGISIDKVRLTYKR